MVKIKPFKGLRPLPEHAQKVASPPYDVLSSVEAREMASTNPHSFLHVVKPEIDLPGDTDPYSDVVYAKAKENLEKLINDHVMKQEDKDSYYLYQIQMGDHIQTGLVTVASVDDYTEGRIKKHEFTRPAKEDDRTKHILTSKAQAGPVFCVFRADPELRKIFDELTNDPPEFNFTADDGIRHTLWVIKNPEHTNSITRAFEGFDAIYIADGHHRSAAGTRAAGKYRELNPNYNGNEEFNYFLTVIFPDDEMKILPYNRVVKDLSGMSEQGFMEKLRSKFDITNAASKDEAEPKNNYEYGMFLDGQWYRLKAQDSIIDRTDPVESLDVQVLAQNVLKPLLKIEDPRTDPRIDFVGGIRGLKELEKLVNSGEWKVAFALYPTSIEQLLSVADAGKVMPPKSTWFEPKLRSGMVVHLLEE